MAPRGFRPINEGFKKVGRGLRRIFHREEDVPPPPPRGSSTAESKERTSTIPTTESARERVLQEVLAREKKEEEGMRQEEEERERQEREKERIRQEEEKKRNWKDEDRDGKGGGGGEAEPAPSEGQGDKHGGDEGAPEGHGAGGGQSSNGEKSQSDSSLCLKDVGHLLDQDKNKDGDGREREFKTGKSNSSKDNSSEGDSHSGLSGETKQGTSFGLRSVVSSNQEALIPSPEVAPDNDHLGVQSGWVSASAVDPSAACSFSSNPHGNNDSSWFSLGSKQYPSQPRVAPHPNTGEVLTLGGSRSRLIRASVGTDWVERRLREQERVERQRELTRSEQQDQYGQNFENSAVEDSTGPANQDPGHHDGDSSPEQELSQSGEEAEEDGDASQKSKSSETDDHPGKENYFGQCGPPGPGAGYSIGTAGGQPSTNAGGRPMKGAKSTTKSDQDPLQIDGGLPFHGVIQRLGTISRADENWSQVCTAVNVEVRLTEDNYPVVQSGTKIPENLSWSDACKSHDMEDLLKDHDLVRLQDLIRTAGNWMSGFRVFLDIQSNLNADKVLEHLCRELAGVDDDVIPRDLVVICLSELRYLPFVKKLQGYTVVLNCLNLNTAQQAIEMDTSTPIHVKLKYSTKINVVEGEAILKFMEHADKRRRDVYIEPIDDEHQIKWCIRVNFAGIVTRRSYDLDRWYREAEDERRRLSWKGQPLFSLIVDGKGEVVPIFGP